MRSGNIKMALVSLRMARWRSLLTMFGIIVGVVAVVATISLGEGVKRQLTDQISRLGKSVIVVRPGDNQSSNYFSSAGIFSRLNTSPLTASDVKIIRQSRGVKDAVPMGTASGFASVGKNHLKGGSVIATSSELPTVLRQPIRFGVFFSQDQSSSFVAVIGKTVAEQLFDETAPIGRTLTIRGQDYLVTGVFDDFSGSSLSLGADLNKAVFIPYQTAVDATGPVPISEIFAISESEATLNRTSQTIRHNLAQAHAGQQDFSILQRKDALQASSSYVSLITQVFAAVAALSLLVGGIGIANIMLVSVTERTREIGVRKAVGATNRQILAQFLIEAATLSLVGGLIGICLALGLIFILRVSTDLHPIITWPVLLAAPLIAWVVGVIFGVAPAAVAARKHPIDALRYE